MFFRKSGNQPVRRPRWRSRAAPWRRHALGLSFHAKFHRVASTRCLRRGHVPRIASAYTPRRPHDIVLHRLVREYLATFHEHAETTYAAPLLRYLVNAFERYLACGD